MTRQLKKELLRCCILLCAAALLFRGAARWGPKLWETARALSGDPRTASFLYYLNTGQVVRLPAARDEPGSGDGAAAEDGAYSGTASQTAGASGEDGRELPPLRFRDLPEDAGESVPEAPSEGAAAPEDAPVFSSEEAAALTVFGNCTLPYDKEALLLSPLPSTESAEGPQVLIVQTHSTEAYTQAPGWEYEETELCRTLDENYSVIRVGTEIATALEARGIGVIHDKTINDYPSYAGSYDRMAEIIQGYLDAYPSIRMVLDVHRDAFEEADGALGATAEAGGPAKVMLVVGTDEGGLYHPNWQGNLSFALKLEALLQRDAPGLSRGISLCTQRYNQNLTPLSLLCEFGAAGDALEDALSAADTFADILGDLLLAS